MEYSSLQTWLTATGTYVLDLYGITRCYLTAGRDYIPIFTPAN